MLIFPNAAGSGGFEMNAIYLERKIIIIINRTDLLFKNWAYTYELLRLL